VRRDGVFLSGNATPPLCCDIVPFSPFVVSLKIPAPLKVGVFFFFDFEFHEIEYRPIYFTPHIFFVVYLFRK